MMSGIAVASKLLKKMSRRDGLMEWISDHYFHSAIKVSFKTDLPFVKPLTAVISVINCCNSRCVYCDAWKNNNKGHATAAEWLDVVSQLSNIGITELVFSGGEPLMSADLERIIKAADDDGIFTQVITNGLLLSNDRMRSLLESGVKGVIVSVDSLEASDYTATRGVPFKYASQALEVLFEFKRCYPDLYAGINVVVTAKNLSAYAALINTASDNGVYVAFQSYSSHPAHVLKELMPSEENEDQFREAIQLIKSLKSSGKLVATSMGYIDGILPFMQSRSLPADFKCLSGYLGVNIDWALNVMPCWNMPPVGNLRETSLEDIWYSDKFHEVRQKMRKLHCPKCWILCHSDVESMTRIRSRKSVS